MLDNFVAMRISGFTMVKNGQKLYYPVKESIQSILPLVDEFIVAMGDCDSDDETEQEIADIHSSKIKIIRTVWDLKKYPLGMENAHQTDIAKNACTGDWLFYLQADEVVHEKDLPLIETRCKELLDDEEVEGLLFHYLHFWGDYQHYHRSHGWYSHEIRIIRNVKDIHSWKSAQSFRRIPHFDGISYRQKKGAHKLKVAAVDASIYHYGFVRPPRLMKSKSKSLDTIHKGEGAVSELYRNEPPAFNYGAMKNISLFKGMHPAVMAERIRKFNWGNELNYSTKERSTRYKHDLAKNRLLSFIENNFFSGKQLFAPKNYVLLSR